MHDKSAFYTVHKLEPKGILSRLFRVGQLDSWKGVT